MILYLCHGLQKKKKFNASFIKLSNKINLKVTNWTILKILENCKKIKKKKIKLLIVGLAYKKDINDERESPAIKILKKLSKKKFFTIKYIDPYIPHFFLNKKKLSSINLTNTELMKNDIVIITTDHSGINFKKIRKYAKQIIDTRGVYKGIKDTKIIHA